MGAYLIDNPPVRDQYRNPRREKPSGVVVVHTAETIADTILPDASAENVANFIRTRTSAGSYHDLADSDTCLQVVPYEYEAYGDATGSNRHGYHVSGAVQASKWGTYPKAHREAVVKNMARGAARYAKWLKKTHGITIPARRITREQSEARVPGFISHGERDPATRTDPGSGFLWDLFLTTYAALMAGESSTTEEAGLAAADAQNVKDYMRALLLDGYTTGGEDRPSILDVLVNIQGRFNAQNAQIAALSAAVKALATSAGLDAAKVQASVDAAVRESLSDLEITLTPKES